MCIRDRIKADDGDVIRLFRADGTLEEVRFQDTNAVVSYESSNVVSKITYSSGEWLSFKSGQPYEFHLNDGSLLKKPTISGEAILWSTFRCLLYTSWQ